jgi:thioredoxin 1
MAVIHLDNDNFHEEVEQSALPVFVDFWAEWCGPCRMIAPVIDQIASELEGKLRVGKVNVDEAQELAARFNVMSIPTMMIFKGGQVVDQMVGAMPKHNILERIKPHIS